MFKIKVKARNLWSEFYLLRKIHGNKRMSEL